MSFSWYQCLNLWFLALSFWQESPNSPLPFLPISQGYNVPFIIEALQKASSLSPHCLELRDHKSSQVNYPRYLASGEENWISPLICLWPPCHHPATAFQEKQTFLFCLGHLPPVDSIPGLSKSHLWTCEGHAHVSEGFWFAPWGSRAGVIAFSLLWLNQPSNLLGSIQNDFPSQLPGCRHSLFQLIMANVPGNWLTPYSSWWVEGRMPSMVYLIRVHSVGTHSLVRSSVYRHSESTLHFSFLQISTVNSMWL